MMLTSSSVSLSSPWPVLSHASMLVPGLVLVLAFSGAMFKKMVKAKKGAFAALDGQGP